MKRKNQISALLLSGAVGVAVAFGGTSPAVAAASSAPAESTGQSAPSEAQLRDFEQGLALVEQIPDDVLVQGDAATQQWLAANAPANTAPEGMVSTQASVLGCGAAIATVIASTAFPAAKILKVKALIKSLGGVTEAAKIMWGASFSYEKVQALGGAAAALAGELIGVTQIKEQCFS
ncbi:hypothetical protein [Clavibacter sp. Sh2126]|uniref:Secreted protein n=1 Tax=Clavibacter tessellarius TaxID=31965 RepID=A0A154V316_9MICO|nr:hypothetical protein AWH51_06795 [Clavibacter michiganensis subsp. tessellarius]